MKTKNKTIVGYIYFLYADDELRYVGKTTNLEARLFSHNHYKDITTYSAIPYTSSIDMAIDEIKFINAYKPTLNILDKFEFDESTYEVLDITTLEKCEFAHKHNTKSANIQGTIRLKNTHFWNSMESMIGTAEMKILSYIFSHKGKYNIVLKQGRTEPATPTYLANKFNVSYRTVGRILKKGYDSGLFTRCKKKLIVNPYLLVPYIKGLPMIENDKIAYQLQQWWDGDRKELPKVITT